LEFLCWSFSSRDGILSYSRILDELMSALWRVASLVVTGGYLLLRHRPGPLVPLPSSRSSSSSAAASLGWLVICETLAGTHGLPMPMRARYRLDYLCYAALVPSFFSVSGLSKGFAV
jgi:hypothetical protein